MPTLERIQEKMKKLQAQADTLIAKKAQAAVDQIRKIMLAHGLTTEDIEAKAKTKREAKAADGTASIVKSKAVASLKGGTPPKYQHPKTGATWTGHGRAPAWIADAKDRSKFLIASGADSALGTSSHTVSKAKTAAKKASTVTGVGAHRGQRTGPQPAKYLDPKSGATWSGRGPAPAWLATAKDRSKFLVDGADVVVTTASAASNVSKPKPLAASRAVEKKSATKKGVAMKPVTKKVDATKVIANKAAASGKTLPTKNASNKSSVVTVPEATVAN